MPIADVIDMVPEFNLSQELVDHLQEELEEESIELVDDVDGWYDNIDDVDDGGDNLIDITDDPIDIIVEDKSFKAVYAKGIAPMITIVENHFKRYVWSERPVMSHPPASDIEIAELFNVLRKIRFQ